MNLLHELFAASYRVCIDRRRKEKQNILIAGTRLRRKVVELLTRLGAAR